ncbi:hypothetical protein Ccrd_015629 [Cynara cardunculus var. scolymus]|uniref:Epidermal patterning factor-like protein n=1 Tax=Cynara cardunculus var. scolymus TaxID=59895 RepID=A0A118K3J8_CYNCS|nr:hypothetical protein Ccrd_015629 [Cynara cardunculus var. scolymus]
MAPARTYTLGLRVVVTVILLLFVTVSHSISVDEGVVASVQQNKKILGSRPPGCVNKCVNCRPCQATLVIPPHPKMIDYRHQSSNWEDNYYLLSWKCKCGDKLFQP